MTAPTITTRINWANVDGFVYPAFVGLYDTVTPLGDEPIEISSGASADFEGEAIGQLKFALDNVGNQYTPDRNWHDNPSFEDGGGGPLGGPVGIYGWAKTAIASLTAAATSITQVTDHATGTGTKAGEAVLTGTVNSGVYFAIPYPVQNGETYSFGVWLKSISGNLNVRAGLASSGTPANIGSTSSNITASWALYTGTFTATADRNNIVCFVRTTTAAAATVRIDAIQVNPGATLNDYIEAPTKGQLTSGRPVHMYATDGGVDTALFYGFVKTFAPDLENEQVVVTCYDPFQQMANQSIDESNGYVPMANSAPFTVKKLRQNILALNFGAVPPGVQIANSLDSEPDVLLTTATLGGDPLSAMKTLNELSGTRHWIEPSMTYPFYAYTTENRTTFAAKTSSLDLVEDVQGISGLDIDETAIVNYVSVMDSTGGPTLVYDLASLLTLGMHRRAIDGSAYYPNATIANALGAVLVRRYAQPVVRPTIVLKQQFTNILALGLNDVLRLTIAKFLMTVVPFVILRKDLKITDGGNNWSITYSCESFPY